MTSCKDCKTLTLSLNIGTKINNIIGTIMNIIINMNEYLKNSYNIL